VGASCPDKAALLRADGQGQVDTFFHRATGGEEELAQDCGHKFTALVVASSQQCPGESLVQLFGKEALVERAVVINVAGVLWKNLTAYSRRRIKWLTGAKPNEFFFFNREALNLEVQTNFAAHESPDNSSDSPANVKDLAVGWLDS